MDNSGMMQSNLRVFFWAGKWGLEKYFSTVLTILFEYLP